MEIEAHEGSSTGGRPGAAERSADGDRRRRQVMELRAAISLVSSAAADLGWGARPDVRLLPDGRLWLDELQVAVSAAQVYQAARHLVAAQVSTVAERAGVPVGDVAGPWLLSLHTNEAMIAPDLDLPQDDAA
ncbi:hypothetical protein [Modestobacter altitudinis]|uniref:hypothetical protein n=1 Tax=Modestobacter altitudinis TaxID=2213158 RepID=UPI001FEB4F15|nr:hypothetical protein [Modestobacter altitudinis]